MKKLLLLLGGLLCLSARAVNLEWDANPSPNVAGYKMYFGSGVPVYSDVVNFNHSLNGFIPTPPGKTYHFSVVAYDTAGIESDFSKDLVYEPHDVLIESCDVVVGGTWHILRHDVLDMTYTYRLRLGADQLLKVQLSDDGGVSWGDKFSIPVSFVPEHQFFRMTIL